MTADQKSASVDLAETGEKMKVSSESADQKSGEQLLSGMLFDG
jgi:hypothetical protein